MRRFASTWFAKALFALLVLSFAVWGIEDIVRNLGRDTAVARVGDAEVEVAEAQAAARRELQGLQRRLGAQFEPTERIREAVARGAVERLVLERSLGVEARRLGLATPEEAVRAYVFAIPAFQLGGRFDRRALDTFLRQSELDEAGLLRLVAADLQRQQLAGAVRAGAASPGPVMRALLAWRLERRVAEVVSLPVADAPEPEPPTEAALRRFHETNPELFSTPERRTATVALLSGETLADEVAVGDADVAAAYEAAPARFSVPERRAVEQALLPDEEKARSVAVAWRNGAAFTDVAALARALGGSGTDLGTVARDALPIPELAEAAFGAAEGAVTDPVRTPFGWHVLRAAKVEPASSRPLAEVRDELRAEIARERAADLAFERANRVEDALAGGATLEEAARAHGMRAATVTVDSLGRGADGRPVELPVPEAARDAVVRSVFAASEGGTPRLEEVQGAGGFVAVDVRSIAPAALRPFAEVEEQVRQEWARDARRRTQEERAAALLAAVRGGTSLADAAAAAGGLRVERVGPFLREAGPAEVPPVAIAPELRAPLFEAAPGGEAVVARTRDGFAVARLAEVVPADLTAALAAEAVRPQGGVRAEVERAMQDDLEAQYTLALRERAGARVNEALMPQVVPR